MLSVINHQMLMLLYSVATSSSVASGTVIFFAEWFPFLVIASIVIYEFIHLEEESEVIRVLVRTAFPTMLVCACVMLGKHMFPSPRPFAEDLGISPLISVSDPFGAFPSAHAAIFGSLAGTMFATHFGAGKWYLLAALIISIARVAAGVHWPADVLTGILFGLFLGYCISKLLSLKKKQHNFL